MPCRVCKVDGPTKEVCFQQNIGMWFARRSLKLKAELCRRCMGAYFRSFTLTTLFLGWFGIISFFVTPVFIVSNVVQYLGARSLPEPGPSASNLPLDFKIRVVSQKTLLLELVYGIVIWGIVLGFIIKAVH
jgi:hypothetical protein